MPGRSRPNMGEMIFRAIFGSRFLNIFGSAINLTKNSQFFVRQGDVERLIAQGYLQKLS